MHNQLEIFYTILFKNNKEIIMKTKLKRQPSLNILLLFISILMFKCSTTKSITNNLEKAAIIKMINDHSFIFIAERMDPLRGRSRILTSSYDVRVNNDSLVSYLPYFGRAYSAPIDPTKIGTQFTSTKFTYQVNQEKNNQWRISIVPKDVQGIQELIFTIFDNGNTTLSITSASRDQIFYTGHLKKVEEK